MVVIAHTLGPGDLVPCRVHVQCWLTTLHAAWGSGDKDILFYYRDGESKHHIGINRGDKLAALFGAVRVHPHSVGDAGVVEWQQPDDENEACQDVGGE